MKKANDAYNDMVAARSLNHVGHQLRRYGCPTLVFLVLSCIGEQRDHSGNTFGTGDFASMDHNAEFHERGVHSATPGVDDVHVVFSYRVDNPYVRFADAILFNLRPRDWQAKASGDDSCKLRMAGPRENFDSADRKSVV